MLGGGPQADGWQDILQAPGTHWRLIFTAGTTAADTLLPVQLLSRIPTDCSAAVASCFLAAVMLGRY